MASADVDMQATTRVKDDEEMDVDDEEDEMMSAEDEDDADDLPTKAQLNDERIYSLDILKLVKEAQQARGLRHGDYTRYRQYCERKVHRLRKALKFPQGTRTRYQGKPLKIENMNDARHLEIPLFITERAWSYGMQLKQESGPAHPRKKHHMLRRYKKAAHSAAQLVKLCNAVKCDARTRLEAEAYCEWMRGVHFFHKELWKQAVECLSHAKTIYERISATVDEDTRALYRQRVEETNPQIRFCAYNIGDESAVEDLIKMRLQPGTAMGQDVLSKLDDLIAQNRGRQSGSEVSWLGKTIPIKNQKVRVLLISSDEVMKQLDTVKTADAKLEVLENTLNMLREAGQLVQEEVKTTAKDQQVSSTGSVTSTQLLSSYITYLKNQRNTDRALLTIQIMKGQVPLSPEKEAEEKAKKHKPQDFVRLYDTIVENCEETAALPGVVGTAVMESMTSQGLIYKAYRALYIGQAFAGVKKYPEALTFFSRVNELSSLAKKPKNNEIDSKLFDELSSMAKEQKSMVMGYSILASEEFTEVESEMVARFKKENGLMEIPPVKPFTFDLVLNSVKLPSLEDKLQPKKTATKTVKKEQAPAEAAGATTGAGLGSALKGWIFGGKKK
ncbi:hypothetical protein RvY_19242 [Ramazzottius varieornatus]|uniref:Signal recognition particle subunit SRP68 n=1 Tax=Ramazzottius varieornatus TaxID=947166 RepID=A0A1D1W8S7_RAMVA|nr:hypothetical protein RvY_19242 [Ramazzottius varieornatus]